MTHAEKALALANQGIAFDAAGDHKQAAQRWEIASDYANAHLSGEDIDYWIKSGFGAALYEIGAYERSIAVSLVALDWCSRLNQPLPALTIARCHLKLGDPQAAETYLAMARALAGDEVLTRLTPDERLILDPR
ncbi:hypothetical protein [Caulobacter mirabilis]|uniref:MalT-like TPR region domain-containing protein n=1 Tax=Caulobacter mirabilis TaxID=69666 RepID=A0A2D2B2B4_9CAUL|nr:hypothetical protein [Caulobacter mirabilis]ATQ44390.1 hypothetical protein CSW64_19365 [Caulobacter mirabilis]